MQKIKIVEIGFGPHAKRVYGPALQRWGREFNADLSLVVDLEQKEQEIRNYFKNSPLKPEFLFIDPFDTSGKELPYEVEKFLNRFVDQNRIQGVIISTEPLSHFVYAKWALKKGLNILMDKPITTRRNVVSNMKAARRIEDDYIELLSDYQKLQETKETIFIINTQRRFHPGFKVVNELLAEIAYKTNCPITAIQSMHCDGQWRLPNEIVTQDYHPYNSGYGKASHSGYHIFDAVYQFYKNSKLVNRIADSMEIFSSFFQPRGFLHQLNEEDYLNFFGKAYQEVRGYDDKRLYRIFKNYGEIDLSAVIRLKKGEDCVGNISINLIHNGFSRRTWMLPGVDLYKGNGRVKHEYHNIQQGPFQNIHIHSYQSKDKHDVNSEEDFELGGNNHFDIYVFRNCGMTGDRSPLRVITMRDLISRNKASILDDSKLIVEQVKYQVVEDFVGYLQGKIDKSKLVSNIDDHLMPVQIMSGIYQSHIRYMKGENPLVTYKLNI